MKFVPFYCLLCMLLFSCSGSEKAEVIILTFQPEKGKQVEMDYESTFEMPESNALVSYFMEIRLDIEEKTDEYCDIKSTFQKITLKGKIDSLEIDLDASKPDTLQADALLYAEPYFVCLNQQFLTRYNRKLEKISEELLTEKNPKNITDPVNKAPFFTTLPDTEITVGSKWKSTVELKSGKGMVVNTEFEVKKIENDKVYVNFRGKTDGGSEGFGQNYSIIGSVKGNFTVDLKTGLPIQSEMVQNLIQSMGGKEQPLIITIRQNIK